MQTVSFPTLPRIEPVAVKIATVMKQGCYAVIVAVATVGLFACASGRIVQTVSGDQHIVPDEAEHRLFLVGDAGEDNAILRDNLELLRTRLRASSVPATVLYLGDNLYPYGVPNPEDSIAYREAVNILDAQVQGLEGLAWQVVFIPGNHDWNKGKAGGLEAIRNQDAYIRLMGDKKVKLLPRKGCPGPEVIELTKDVVVLIIDSQWWLHDWRVEKDINAGCEIRTRADFITAFDEILKEYKEQQVIVAMHHPLMSAGSHGGYFRVRDHLFPLTNISSLKNLFIPLPVIGSIYPVYRSNFGHIQDIVHPRYQQLRQGLLAAASLYNNVIFTSGHEHSLEYHTNERHHFIVSGSGSRTSEIGKPKTLQYGHGVPGFVQLNLKPGGAVDMLIWESARPDAPVFSKSLTGMKYTEPDVGAYPDVREMPATTMASVSTEYDKRGLHRFLLGKRYRDVYSIPVEAKVLNLQTAHGGLTPVKRGGGFQTNSLRLLTSDKREYAARSMNKDASKLLPEVFKSTFASDILQDQFTASHPYAAFVIPGMASRAGVYHTNPELYFLPKQHALGRYAEDFGDQLFLLEERPAGDWSQESSFGNSAKIISYTDVLELTMDDYRNVVDQEFVLRSRLFDMFLGDWDRHDDQWRWAAFDRTDGKGQSFRPIPRDRDQAFSDYDGLVIRISTWFTPTLRKTARFSGDVKNVKWFNDNGKFFDRDFLNALTEDKWLKVAKELQDALTDDVIETHIRQWPAQIFTHKGEHIISTLRERRNNLQSYASRYYHELSKTILIRGTNHADYFEITRSKGQTRIRVYDSNRQGDKNALYYDRTFKNTETKEIQLYALRGHDRVEINGGASSGIRVYVVGGPGSDKVLVSGSSGAGGVRILDTQPPDEIVSKQQVNYRQVEDADNTYERKSFLYDYAIPQVIIAGNPDDGLLLGGGVQWTKHGFRKSPFASRQSLSGFYALATKAFGVDYAGEWVDVLGSIDVGLTANYRGPTFVQNFFGFGNEAIQDLDRNINFYRVRKRSYSIVPSLRAGKELGTSLVLRGGLESHQVEDTEGRFVTLPQNGLPPDVFDEMRFGVVGLDFRHRKVDNPTYTRRGFDFRLSSGLDIPLSGDNRAHRYLKTSVATYYRFKYLGQPVLATRFGAEWHGGDFQFFQAAILGAQDNFRGVRKERFAGDKMFYHNTDLRFVIAQWRSYLVPAAMGIQVNFDHGRVWRAGETSDTWHYAYGGGVWVSPFQSILLTLSYHKSDVDNRISVAMGFLF